MSTSAMVKFYLNGETLVGKETCIDKLKNLCDGWDMSDALIPIVNDKVKDASSYSYQEFLGYMDLEQHEDWKSSVSEDGCIYLAKDFKGEEPPLDDVSIDMVKSGKYTKVYGWKVETNHGYWYNIDSFYRARLEFETKEKEYNAELVRLKALKNTVTYYTLKEEEMQRLEDDISFNSEMLEGTKDRIYICQYMIDIMETMADMYGGNYDDFCYVFVWFA